MLELPSCITKFGIHTVLPKAALAKIPCQWCFKTDWFDLR